MALGNTLSEIITQSINDFDKIYDAISSRGVENFTAAKKADGSNPTSTYAGAINGYLVSVSEDGTVLKKLSELETSGNKLMYRGSITPTGTSITTSGTTITVKSTGIGNGGYYPATATIEQTFTGEALKIDTTNVSDFINEEKTAYIFKVDGGDKLLASVEVGKGSVAPSITLAPTVTSNAEISLKATGTVKNASVLEGASANGFTVEIGATSKYSGSIVQTVTSNFIPGYITSFTDTNCKTGAKTEIAETAGTGDEKTIVIPSASISGASATAEHSVVVGTGLKTVASADDGIAVTSKVTSLSVDSSKLTVTAGYIGAEGKNHSGDSAISFTDASLPADEVTYIKKGSLGTAAGNAATVAISGDLQFAEVNEAGTAYETTFTVNEKYEKTIDDGYITEADKLFEANLSGSKKVSVAKGAVSVSGTIEIGDVTSAYLVETSDYAIDIDATTSLGKPTLTEGYIKSGDVTVTDPTAVKKTIYLKPGSVAPAAGLNTVVTNVEDGKIASVENTEIFLNTVPTKGDYYTITASSNAVATAGYVPAGTTEGTNAIKYLPKATFKYHVGETTADSFMEVDQGGYLPSGVIADIAEITGSPDYADVKATLSASTVGILGTGTEIPAGAYEISIGKNASTNSGYITGTAGQGTLTLDGKYYIAKATAAISTTKTDVVLDANGAEYDAASGTYKFATAKTAGNVQTLYTQTVAGYQTAADVSGIDEKDHTVDTAVGASLTLNKAELALDSGSLALTTETNMVKATGEDTAYSVTISSAASSIDVKTTTAGYLSAEDKTTVTPSITGSTVYIKSGVNATVSGTADAASLTGAAGTDHSYTVTYPGQTVAVSGDIAEGYYKGKTASGNATVGAGELKINPAAGTVTVSGGTAISSKDVALVNETTAGSSANYLAITAASTGAATVNAPTTPGYYENASQITVSGEVTGATMYVRKAPETVADVGPAAEVDIVENANYTYAVAGTAQAYNTANTNVTLSDNAMGAGVQADLLKLRKRLLGAYATPTV